MSEDLRARLEIAEERVRIRDKVIRYVAFVTTGDDNGDPQLGADRLLTRIEGAEAAEAEVTRLREALETLCQAVEGHRGGSLSNDGLWHYRALALAALTAPEARDGQ